MLGMRDEGFGDLLSLTAFPGRPLFAALDALRQEGTVRVEERGRDRRALARRTDIDPQGSVWDEEGATAVLPDAAPEQRTRRNARRSMERLEAAAGALFASGRPRPPMSCSKSS
ncbi:hypothetical protein [Nesterenkonia pannonica]|uniref:hypothetical protein n=1 Tax=Nesterenkonia pannonica TaxID=1548602 RepID=UPI002164E22A|nr:hypothetical protein [Nesterenkonia pannonica]